jgi:CelD/BcsL family acetyltransferase involved in cellulose biosynthesis
MVGPSPPERDAALRLDVVDTIDAVRDDWSTLAERSGCVFATWEWCEAWAQHVLGGNELTIGVARDADGGARAVVPLYRARIGPFRALRLAGDTVGDFNGPVHAAGDRAAGEWALRALLDATPGWDLFLGRHLPGDGWDAALGGERLTVAGAPRLDVAGRTFDDLLAARSPKARQALRRMPRRLEQTFARVEYRRCQDNACVDESLDAIARLHAGRWGDDHPFSGARGEFHRAFGRVALERGWLRLWRVEVDGEAAAFWHGFRYGGTDWFYQQARDPRFDRYAPALALIVHTVRTAFDDGIATYHFLRGEEAFKRYFTDDVDPATTVVVSRGARGRLAALGARSWARAPEGLRRRVAFD